MTAPGKDFPVTKAPPLDALRGATREALRNLVSLAIGEKVAFILLAGDLYDGVGGVIPPVFSSGSSWGAYGRRTNRRAAKVSRKMASFIGR